MIISHLVKNKPFSLSVFSMLIRLALKLQKGMTVTKVQIKVVFLPLNFKLIKIDEEKI
jgi:hypothetical protein